MALSIRLISSRPQWFAMSVALEAHGDIVPGRGIVIMELFLYFNG